MVQTTKKKKKKKLTGSLQYGPCSKQAALCCKDVDLTCGRQHTHCHILLQPM
jgi:hypothetical protein